MDIPIYISQEGKTTTMLYQATLIVQSKVYSQSFDILVFLNFPCIDMGKCKTFVYANVKKF